MAVKYVQKPEYILNQQLTGSFEPVEVGIDWEFSSYFMNTTDNTDYEIRLNEGDTTSFKFNLDAGTLTLDTPWDRREDSNDTVLFYAKGSGVLQILFSV